ncbi:putative capsular polysaccharide biosynthesis protein [Carnobacterium maltaromaticum]|uniref:YveK family protein n=1 Tax=Carnobacterium maltaromaticum TaxID=2751 RepID=UPI00191B92D5|nr:Wzz/FepE/Etk N-terminal domain-containing protein [Carnobacterium maltaromaticum]CAD5902611.1 putative capsular polysaccharide biosynthesis protein [Carnobacterium maltaromaticum]
MERTVDLKFIVQFLKKFWLLLSLIIISCTVITLFFAEYFIKPIYEVSTDILIVQTKEEMNQTTIQSTQQFISTYSVIIKSTKVIGKVKENLDLDESVISIRSKLKVENQNNSQIITLKVKDRTPEKAEKIATEIVVVLQKEIKSIMDEKNITVLSPARSSDSLIPININKKVSTLFGLMIGTVLGILASILVSMFNTTIKSEDDIKKLTDIPIIGTIQKKK